MLKILIVDDEELIREGIEQKIKCLFSNAQVIGKAEDAYQAMEIIDALSPNVVITDIRMPEIDGLKLIEMIESKNKEIKFVLVSGYQDFEYARRGIELGVENYLLKPIKNAEFKEILESLDKKINDEVYNREYLLELKQKAQNNIVFLKNKYLNDAIYNSGEFNIEYILKPLEQIGISFINTHYSVVTITLDNLYSMSGFLNRQKISPVKFAIINIAEEVLLSEGIAVGFENLKRDNQIVVVLNNQIPDSAKTISRCEELLKTLSRVLSLNAVIGIGRSYDNINFLHSSYMESYTAAMQSLVLENSKVIYIGYVPDSNLVTYFIPENEKLLLFSYINSRNMEKAFAIIDSIFDTARKQELPYANIKALSIDISIMLGKTVKDAGGSWENVFDEDIFSDDYISRFKNLEQLNSWLKDCISSICNYLFDLRKSDGKKAIEEIKKYIDTFYYTDINFNELSGKYFINSSYLSHLFKSQTGEKYIDYLTAVRIDKAKKLLTETSLKSYEIANMIGYNDSNYFSDVFAKNVGLTPTKYRKRLLHI